MAVKTAHRREWLWPVTIVSVALGGLIAFQVRGQMVMQQQGLTQGQRAEVVNDLYIAAQKQITDLNKQVKNLTTKLTKLERVKGGDAQVRQAVLNQYQIALGLVPVKGPGIHLILDDSTLAREIGNGEAATSMLIHDFDLTAVVNELRVAGAEAIMINDQRVVPATAIRCVGSVILVNGVRQVPPYHIYAIGLTKILRGALEMPGGILDELRAAKFQVKLTEEEEMQITSIGSTPRITQAKLMTEAGAR